MCCLSVAVLQPVDHFGVNENVIVQSLLHDPNPNSPANNTAAQLYRENRREYEKKVAAIVQASRTGD